ncbi:MAG: hypothetical protein HYU88_14635 [Chloroflexi bacterium]|nr:hypothetical protein [Chloroflexota bacterium]
MPAAQAHRLSHTLRRLIVGAVTVGDPATPTGRHHAYGPRPEGQDA